MKVDATPEARKSWLGLLARADHDRLVALAAPVREGQSPHWLRPAEIGSVMVRARTGGSGAPFNMGEMTVTRCSVELPGGAVGHGYVQGRSRPAAEAAALVDALMQTDAADTVQASILDPLGAQEAMTRTERAEKAAATKVEFFTLVRGT